MKERKKSVTAAAEFTGARYLVNRASHGKIECILTYTFLSLPVLYSDSSSTGPPAAVNGVPRTSPDCPSALTVHGGATAERGAGDDRERTEGVR